MLTQQQIEDKNFTLLASNNKAPSNDGSYDVYIAERKTKNTQNTDITYIPCLLEYYDTGVCKITDYFNEPIRYREYYFIGYIKTVEEFNKILDNLAFTIEPIEDISKITINYP